MNKPIKSQANRPLYTLGDLIVAVSASCRNSREASAVITDLLQSGQVPFLGSQGTKHRSSK